MTIKGQTLCAVIKMKNPNHGFNALTTRRSKERIKKK